MNSALVTKCYGSRFKVSDGSEVEVECLGSRVMAQNSEVRIQMLENAPQKTTLIKEWRAQKENAVMRTETTLNPETHRKTTEHLKPSRKSNPRKQESAAATAQPKIKLPNPKH